MINVRLPPTRMVARPWSHPLILASAEHEGKNGAVGAEAEAERHGEALASPVVFLTSDRSLCLGRVVSSGSLQQTRE
jgi:hypothetical protein